MYQYDTFKEENMKRQKIRFGILLISLLLFPIIIWYFSPYLIIMGAMEHIVNGSFIVFGILLITSMFLGRGFCGYVCPISGLQECAKYANDRNPKQGWRNYVKYVIFVIWIAAIILCYMLGKGQIKIDFLYMTDHGISVSKINNYIIYYGIIVLMLVPSLLFGKRIPCHYYCWIAPFMVIGSKIGQVLHLPQLHIQAETEKCIECHKCNQKCPMSLDVQSMVKDGHIGSTECIQCGECVDTCPKKVLNYSMNCRK